MRFVITIITLLISSVTFGQDKEKYSELKKEAWSLYGAKEYKKSANKYKEAFDVYDGKASPNDRYNAACSYALAKDIEKHKERTKKIEEENNKGKN